MHIDTSSLGARDFDPYPETGNDRIASGTGNRVAWIVAAVVGGVIVVGSTLAFTIVYCTRHRRARGNEGQQRHPFLTRSESFKRRKMSETSLSQEEEERRAELIRKS